MPKKDVFTPEKIVTLMLDTIGYSGKGILQKKIMEPAFGTGNFLIEIVNRLLAQAKKQRFTANETRELLSANIYGFEINEDYYKEAIRRINEIAAKRGIFDVSWGNLICGDALTLYKDYEGTVDYYISNPPYTILHRMTAEEKENIKKLSFTSGYTDMYMAFFSIGLEVLNDDGRLVLITPNSFLRNISQQSFRNYLIEENLIGKIIDFKSRQVFFEDVSVYTCITLLDKSKAETVIYETDDYKVSFPSETFADKFFNKEWNILSKEDDAFLDLISSRPKKLEEIALVKNACITGCDDFFIGKPYRDFELAANGKFIGKAPCSPDDCHKVYFETKVGGLLNSVETGLIKPCVKSRTCQTGYIIFPYKQKEVYPTVSGGRVCLKYEPVNIFEDFPFGCGYFLRHKQKPQYSKSQAINDMGLPKIVFQSMVSKNDPTVKAELLPSGVVVYSGLYITLSPEEFLNDGVFDDLAFTARLKEIYGILISPDFAKYCSLVGKDMSCDYVVVSASNVMDYCFN